MSRQHRYLGWMIAVWLILPLTAWCAAELQCTVSAVGGKPQSSYVSGQQGQIMVRVVRDEYETYRGLPSNAPYELKIEAGEMVGPNFHEKTDWTRQLALQHYVDSYRVRADSVYRAKGSLAEADADRSNLGEFYQFVFIVPDVAGEQRVCIRAVYNHREYGRMEAKLQCLPVGTPRTEGDQRFIWNSLMEGARVRNDVRRAIALADSFVNIGIVDPDWMETAKNMAYEHGEYKKALEYLDYNFEINGITSAYQLRDWTGGRLQVTERRQQDYDRQRKDLISRIGGK